MFRVKRQATLWPHDETNRIVNPRGLISSDMMITVERKADWAGCGSRLNHAAQKPPGKVDRRRSGQAQHIHEKPMAFRPAASRACCGNVPQPRRTHAGSCRGGNRHTVWKFHQIDSRSCGSITQMQISKDPIYVTISQSAQRGGAAHCLTLNAAEGIP